MIMLLILLKKIRDGKLDLADVKNDQKKFKFYLGEIRMGGKKSK